MMIRYMETRGGTWRAGAIAICDKLKAAGVKKRQIVWIDAHNNDNDGAAIFSAFWDDNIKSDEPLEIAFEEQNENYPWNQFYRNAAYKISTLRPESIISMTGSCNCHGRTVFFVFYYNNALTVERQDIHYTEARGDTWEKAAQRIISNLHNEGAKRGQIIGIDAHNNKPNGDAIFSAFWNSSLQPLGDLTLQHRLKIDKDSWNDHYQWAVRVTWYLDVHSITSSCNIKGNGVTYVFHT